MNRERWLDVCFPNSEEEEISELFHENSKVTPYDRWMPQEAIAQRMAQMRLSLTYEQFPVVPLPQAPTPMPMRLDEAIRRRTTNRAMRPVPLSLEDLAAMLVAAYGETRDNAGTAFNRPFRTVPSGGALYPLEIYVHSKQLSGQRAGLYHYNPHESHLRLLQQGDLSLQLSKALIQEEVPLQASAIFFITALFERSTFKYGPRGYRFVLLEAGHVAQNLNLAATALGLGALNLGGYLDRKVDDLLRLDGVTHSTVYMVAIGADADAAPVQG